MEIMGDWLNRYDILGVASDATPEQIRKAYRTLASKTHPDIGGPAMTPLFRSVQDAYETLSNPLRRAAYDRELSGPRTPSAPREPAARDEPAEHQPESPAETGKDPRPHPEARRPSQGGLVEPLTMSRAVGLAFSKYASFSGRSSRREYWYFFLFQTLVFLGLALLFALTEEPAFTVILGIFHFGTLVPALSVTARRLHDGDYSAGYIFLNAIPVVGPIFILLTVCMPSTPGTNRFGPPSEASAFKPSGAAPSSTPGPWIASVAALIMLAWIVGIVYSQAQTIQTAQAADVSRVAAESASRAEAQRVKDAGDRAAAIKAESKANAEKVAVNVERADMQAKGWVWFKDQLYFAWIPVQELKCPMNTRCSQMKVVSMATDGCRGGIYVDASLDRNGLSTGHTTGYSSGLPQGMGALVTLTLPNSADADGITMLDMRCSSY
jgi:uncharacterized membrane protein YhaH (DUF805 family)